MNTYRVYVLNTTNAVAPAVDVAYIRGEKYANAWQNARSALNDKGGELFSDVQCATRYASHGDNFTVAKIDDIKPRNVKLDKAALQRIIADDAASADDKLAAMAKLIA